MPTTLMPHEDQLKQAFVTGPLSEHCKTNIAVIRQMLDVEIGIEGAETTMA